jgi:hypothetical protein
MTAPACLVQRLVLVLVSLLAASRALIAQSTPAIVPRAELSAAPIIRFTGNVDSNSPSFWQRVGSLSWVFILTSTAGQPSLSFGPQVGRLSTATRLRSRPWPGGGVWMEAMVADDDGTLYGYYHNEMAATMCRGESQKKMIPRIGAVRSRDRGATWEPLGIVLEAPPGTFDCRTNNVYFVGGVGDFSVRLDPDSRDLYFFYSQYIRFDRLQGIGVARLAWPIATAVGQDHGVELTHLAAGTNDPPGRRGASDLPRGGSNLPRRRTVA